MATEAPALRAGGRRRPPASGRVRADRRLGYLMVAPAIVLLLAVTAYPLVYNLWNSFHAENLSEVTGQGGWVGFDNYSRMFQSSEFLAALLRTLAFAGISVAIETVLALGLALMLHRKFRGRGLLRVAVLIPWAVPTVVSATLWKTMFDPRSGFVDYIFGLHITWLAGIWTSWVAIFVADAWKNIPFIALILLSGLQVIPTEVYEAARIDGATWWQSFRRLTLPMLKPALAVALIFRLLSGLLVFDVIYIMTGGGPGLSTETLSFLNWQTFLVNTDFGLGGAISVMLVVLCLLAAGIVALLMRTRNAT
jgi:ABC-type sugar transport system permease subunit